METKTETANEKPVAIRTPIFIVAINWNAKGTTLKFKKGVLEHALQSNDEFGVLMGMSVSIVYIIGREFMNAFGTVHSLLPIVRGNEKITLVQDLIYTNSTEDGGHDIPCEYNYLRIPHVYGLFLEELKENFHITSTSVFHHYVGLHDDAYRIFFEHNGSGYFGHRKDLCICDEDQEIELLWNANGVEAEQRDDS
jgi:hypothetical protein